MYNMQYWVWNSNIYQFYSEMESTRHSLLLEVQSTYTKYAVKTYNITYKVYCIHSLVSINRLIQLGKVVLNIFVNSICKRIKVSTSCGFNLRRDKNTFTMSLRNIVYYCLLTDLLLLNSSASSNTNSG